MVSMESRTNNGSVVNRLHSLFRAGMTMIELIIVMVVLAILAGIAIGGIGSAQKNARETAARKSIEAYKDAFADACMAHPGVFAKRIDEYKSPATGNYSGRYAYKHLIDYMNNSLEPELQLTWDDSLRVYRSQDKSDAWGGFYIFTEYPQDVSNPATNYYNATAPTDTTAGGAGWETMGVSIWATGNNEKVITALSNPAESIDKTCFGICMTLHDGVVDSLVNGFDESANFDGNTFVIYSSR